MSAPKTIVVPGQVLYCGTCGEKYVIGKDEAPLIRVIAFGDIWRLHVPSWGSGLACTDCGRPEFQTFPPTKEELFGG